jgi:hypothetical protein
LQIVEASIPPMPDLTKRVLIFYYAWARGIAASMVVGVVYTYTTDLWSVLNLVTHRSFGEIASLTIFEFVFDALGGAGLGLLLSIMPALADALALALLTFRGFFESRATWRHYLILCTTSACIASICVLLEVHPPGFKAYVTVISPPLIVIPPAIGWWVAHNLFRRRNEISSQGLETAPEDDSTASNQPRSSRDAVRRFMVRAITVISVITLIELVLYGISSLLTQ